MILFHSGTKVWDEGKVRALCSGEDAEAILAVLVPQRVVEDRVVWSRLTKEIYDVKTGYQLWHDQHNGVAVITQSGGWKRIWNLLVPHKIKIFLSRFCRNNLLVRNRLMSKGISVPIICPMCNSDVEHLLYVFFDCHFAAYC